MRTVRDVLGLPVINLVNGEMMGEVKLLHYSLSTGQVTGLTRLDDTGSHFVPMELVDRIGEDAVVLKDNVGEEYTEPEKPMSLYGLPVYTREGSDVGTVEDLVLDSRQGQLLGINVSGGLWHDLVSGHRFIPLSQAIVGQDTVIVDEEALQEDEDCS